MTITNLGDLSSAFALRQRNVALRESIDRLTTELASGQVADTRNVLAGNYSTLTDIERRTSLLEGYGVATTEAKLFAGASQQALGLLQDFGSDLSGSLLTAGTSAIGVTGSDTASQAKSTLAGMIGVINTASAGRFLFSGTATDQAPLPDVETVLSAVRTAITGATSPDDVLATADAWFNDPAGFEALVYRGSANGLEPFTISANESVELDIRAVDPKLLEVIKLTAVSALADDGVLGYDVQTQSELFSKTGEALLVAQDNVVSLRAEVGFVESRIEGIAARNAAEVTSMEFAKAGLLAIDPYEAATQLEEVQFQLQSLYSVTVRMSQLSLANFL